MNDDDPDDNTPREQRPPTNSERIAYFVDHPPGTPAVSELVPTPHNTFEVQLDRRLRYVESDVSGLMASRRFWKWAAGIGIPIIGAAVLAVLLDARASVIQSSERAGETRAKMDAIDKRIDDFRSAFDKAIDKIIEDVRELRRHAGLDPRPIVDGRIGANP